jgi:hypothetical protein
MTDAIESAARFCAVVAAGSSIVAAMSRIDSASTLTRCE